MVFLIPVHRTSLFTGNGFAIAGGIIGGLIFIVLVVVAVVISVVLCCVYYHWKRRQLLQPQAVPVTMTPLIVSDFPA